MKCDNMTVLPLADGRLKIELYTNDRSCGTHLSMLSATGKPMAVEIKQFRAKRSLSANSYLWVILDKLATALSTTKEELYHEAVRKVGLFDDIAVPDKAVDAFLRHWQSKGMGWLAEVTEKARAEGYKVIRVYSGSSVYDTKEMSRLIEYVVDEAKEQGIETMTPDQISELISKMEEN